MKEKIKIDRNKSLLQIGNRFYRIEDSGEKIDVIPISSKRLEERVNHLSKKLLSYVNKEMILKDALFHLTIEEIDNIERALKKKPKLKIQQKYGCIELKVGKHIIPIR